MLVNWHIITIFKLGSAKDENNSHLWLHFSHKKDWQPHGGQSVIKSSLFIVKPN